MCTGTEKDDILSAGNLLPSYYYYYYYMLLVLIYYLQLAGLHCQYSIVLHCHFNTANNKCCHSILNDCGFLVIIMEI